MNIRSVHFIRSSKAALDLTVLAAAFICLAFLIRFEGTLTRQLFELLVTTLPVVLLVKFLCLIAFGVRRACPGGTCRSRRGQAAADIPWIGHRFASPLAVGVRTYRSCHAPQPICHSHAASF